MSDDETTTAPAPTEAPEQKKVAITVGRLRAASNKLSTARVRLVDGLDTITEMLVGRESRSSEKVDALRATGSRMTQLITQLNETQRAIDELIELVLDDD